MIYHNIERSAFRFREYVGWDCNGYRYRIRKDGKNRGGYWVYPAMLGCCIPIFYAGTLKLISKRLEERSSAIR